MSTEHRRGVVEGAFELLEALSRSQPAGLSELARAANLPKATTHRLLSQLTAAGVVDRVQSGVYRIGAGLGELARPERPYRRLRASARPFCERLAHTCGAVVVGVLEPDLVRSVAVSSSPRGLQLLDVPGFSLLTAAGQVLLAEQPGGPDSLADRQHRRTRARILARGMAVDEQDVTAGISCVAAPIRAADGRAVASVTAVLVADRIPRGLPERVLRAAEETSRQLAVR